MRGPQPDDDPTLHTVRWVMTGAALAALLFAGYLLVITLQSYGTI